MGGGTYKASITAFREDGEVLRQSNQAAEEAANVRSDEAERRDIRHLLVGDSLRPAGLDEKDVGNENGDPSQQTENGHQVDKVSEDFDGVIGNVHHGEETEAGG